MSLATDHAPHREHSLLSRGRRCPAGLFLSTVGNEKLTACRSKVVLHLVVMAHPWGASVANTVVVGMSGGEADEDQTARFGEPVSSSDGSNSDSREPNEWTDSSTDSETEGRSRLPNVAPTPIHHHAPADRSIHGHLEPRHEQPVFWTDAEQSADAPSSTLSTARWQAPAECTTAASTEGDRNYSDPTRFYNSGGLHQLIGKQSKPSDGRQIHPETLGTPRPRYVLPGNISSCRRKDMFAPSSMLTARSRPYIRHPPPCVFVPQSGRRELMKCPEIIDACLKKLADFRRRLHEMTLNVEEKGFFGAIRGEKQSTWASGLPPGVHPDFANAYIIAPTRPSGLVPAIFGSEFRPQTQRQVQPVPPINVKDHLASLYGVRPRLSPRQQAYEERSGVQVGRDAAVSPRIGLISPRRSAESSAYQLNLPAHLERGAARAAASRDRMVQSTTECFAPQPRVHRKDRILEADTPQSGRRAPFPRKRHPKHASTTPQNAPPSAQNAMCCMAPIPEHLRRFRPNRAYRYYTEPSPEPAERPDTTAAPPSRKSAAAQEPPIPLRGGQRDQYIADTRQAVGGESDWLVVPLLANVGARHPTAGRGIESHPVLRSAGHSATPYHPEAHHTHVEGVQNASARVVEGPQGAGDAYRPPEFHKPPARFGAQHPISQEGNRLHGSPAPRYAVLEIPVKQSQQPHENRGTLQHRAFCTDRSNMNLDNPPPQADQPARHTPSGASQGIPNDPSNAPRQREFSSTSESLPSDEWDPRVRVEAAASRPIYTNFAGERHALNEFGDRMPDGCFVCSPSTLGEHVQTHQSPAGVGDDDDGQPLDPLQKLRNAQKYTHATPFVDHNNRGTVTWEARVRRPRDTYDHSPAGVTLLPEVFGWTY